jgi:hypothetical protein
MIVISILATYALTLILTSAEGPFGTFSRLRNHLTGLNCFICTSVWVGAVIAIPLSHDATYWFIASFGLVGGAVLLDRLTMRER